MAATAFGGLVLASGLVAYRGAATLTAPSNPRAPSSVLSALTGAAITGTLVASAAYVGAVAAAAAVATLPAVAPALAAFGALAEVKLRAAVDAHTDPAMSCRCTAFQHTRTAPARSHRRLDRHRIAEVTNDTTATGGERMAKRMAAAGSTRGSASNNTTTLVCPLAAA
jgi:hypothetical protein